MDWQKGKNWNFEAVTSKVTAEELPFLYFVEPRKDKPEFLQLHRDIFPRPENGGKSSFLEFCKSCAILSSNIIRRNFMAFTTKGSLLASVKTGDEISWQQFYDMYKPLILLKGGDLRLNQTEKEELVQLVMLSFFNTSQTFCYDKSKGRFRDYLKRIIHNKACDLMRKRHDDTVSADELENVLAAIPQESDDRWEKEYQETVLTQAFEKLKLRCDVTTLQSYDLFVRQNLPAKEVVAMLDIKANAVYQHKSRVEEMLRQIVKELDV